MSDLLDSEPITLDAFLELEWARLERFEKAWRKGQTELPEQFPTQLPPGDWDEQLYAFDD